MKMMMDVVEYVELPGIPPTLHAFTEAVYLARGVFPRKPVEFVVPTPVFRDLLRVIDSYGRTALNIDSNGETSVAGVTITRTDKDVPVRLVFARESLVVAPLD